MRVKGGYFFHGRLAEWLMQRTANPFMSVRFRHRPPKKLQNLKKVLAIRLNFVYKALIADLA